MVTGSFRMIGSTLVYLARKHVESDREEQALATLLQVCLGMTYDQGISILLGTHTLTENGAGDLVLGPEEDTERLVWEARLKERYGRRCRLEGETSWYEPVAAITDLGPHDAPEGPAPVRSGSWYRQNSGLPHFNAWMNQRYAHYTWGKEKVCLLQEGVPATVPRYVAYIFTPCATPPAWAWPIAAATPGAALAAHGNLELRGHSHWYPNVKTLSLFPTQEVLRAQRDAETERQVQRTEYLRRTAQAIRTLAGPEEGSGWFTLTIMPHCPAEFMVRVPLLPFLCWALGQTRGRHLMPQYTPVAESGLRLSGDDPYHTDWMLGAFPEQDVVVTYHDPEVQMASFREKARLQKELLGFTAAVLSGQGCVRGHARHLNPGDPVSPGSIAILPNARPEYESVVRAALAVVVPVGGELCHLAQVATEARKIILRVEDCLTRYPDGTPLLVDADNGMVHIEST